MLALLTEPLADSTFSEIPEPSINYKKTPKMNNHLAKVKFPKYYQVLLSHFSDRKQKTEKLG